MYYILWDTLNDELVKLSIEGTPAKDVVALYPSMEAAEEMKVFAIQVGNNDAREWTLVELGNKPQPKPEPRYGISELASLEQALRSSRSSGSW